MLTLLSAAALAARADRPILLEVVFAAGGDADARTVPGARRVDWQALLWDGTERRLAAPALLAGRLAALGFHPGDELVVAGDPVQFGAYAAWALEVAGYPRVALLDGGREAWIADGRPLELAATEVPAAVTTAAATWQAPTWSSERIDRAAVAEVLGDPGWAILDVRSAEEYAGDRVSPPEFAVDHGAAVGGRIPGARWLPFRDLLDDAGRFRPAAELEARLAAAGVGAHQEIVTYCRLGHRAALTWFALRHVLGRRGVQVYDGSWTEWGSLVGAPVER